MEWNGMGWHGMAWDGVVGWSDGVWRVVWWAGEGRAGLGCGFQNGGGATFDRHLTHQFIPQLGSA